MKFLLIKQLKTRVIVTKMIALLGRLLVLIMAILNSDSDTDSVNDSRPVDHVPRYNVLPYLKCYPIGRVHTI